MNKTGRPSIFPGTKTERVQALISKVGKRAFEIRRRELALLAGLKVPQVSDAAVVEFLALGRAATTALIVGTEAATESHK